MGIIARQSIKATIATYFGVAVGFFTTFFVLTRFLTAEEIGLTRVLIDAATLFVSLAQLGTSSSIIRFFPYFRQKEQAKGGAGANFSTAGDVVGTSQMVRLPINSDMHRNRTSFNTDHGFFFWTVVIPFVGFLIFALLYWACRVPLGQWFGEKSPLFLDYYYFVLPLAFFLLYQTIFETNCNVLMRIVVPRMVREVVVRLGLLACYLLYAFRVLSLDGFVVALCVNYGIAALINLGYLIALGQISFLPDWQFLRMNIPLVKNYLRYSSFVFVSALAAALGPTLSSFFITAKMGLDYTGIFAIATYIAVIVSIPYRSLTAIASPQLARATKEQNHAEAQTLIHQVSSNLLLIGGLLFFLIWCNIDLIFHILPNGETYAVARNVVFILSLTQLIVATCTISLTTISFSRYYAFSLLFSLILTITSLCLNNYLIPLYGMEGAAVSTLLSNALYFALAWVVLRFACHLRLLNGNALKTILLLVVLFGVNALWLRFLPMENIWWSSIARSVLLGGCGLAVAYTLRLSPELSKVGESLLKSIKGFTHKNDH